MRRPPINQRALCVIARSLLGHEPTMDDSEWRERIKVTLLARGWDYPQPLDLIGQAMSQVEQSGRWQRDPCRPHSHRTSVGGVDGTSSRHARHR